MIPVSKAMSYLKTIATLLTETQNTFQPSIINKEYRYDLNAA